MTTFTERMKMTQRNWTAALAVLAISATSLCPAWAQETSSERRVRASDATEPAGRRIPFDFAGGNPAAFVAAVEAQYKVDWTSIVTIPAPMKEAQVPKLRVPLASPEELLKLYNRLGDQDAKLGKWHWEGPLEKPNFLVLVAANNPAPAPAPGPNGEVQVRVYSLKYISGTNLNTLAQNIYSVSRAMFQDPQKQGHPSVEGSVVVDQRTASLIATGPAVFQELVRSLVAASDVEDPKRKP
jgi:hypothetical protein